MKKLYLLTQMLIVIISFIFLSSLYSCGNNYCPGDGVPCIDMKFDRSSIYGQEVAKFCIVVCTSNDLDPPANGVIYAIRESDKERYDIKTNEQFQYDMWICYTIQAGAGGGFFKHDDRYNITAYFTDSNGTTPTVTKTLNIGNPGVLQNPCYDTDDFVVAIAESEFINDETRPLRNNPIPLGTGNIKSLYTGCFYPNNYDWKYRTSAGLIEEFALDVNFLERTFMEFINSYFTRNALTPLVEFDKIHLFGIPYIKNVNPGTHAFGVTLGYKEVDYQNQENPAMSFVLTGKIDSTYKVQTTYTQLQRQQLIQQCAAHELLHGRGLNFEYIPGQKDCVHECHSCPQQFDCIMSYWNASWIRDHYSSRHLCENHKGIVYNQLRNKICNWADVSSLQPKGLLSNSSGIAGVNMDSGKVELVIEPEYKEYLIKQSVWFKVILKNLSDEDYYLKKSLSYFDLDLNIIDPSGKRLHSSIIICSGPATDSIKFSPGETRERYINLDAFMGPYKNRDDITGVYKISANYQGIKSNDIEIKKSKPSGVDKEVYDRLFRDFNFYPFNEKDVLYLADIVQSFPQSKYIPYLYGTLILKALINDSDDKFIKYLNIYFKKYSNVYESMSITDLYESYLRIRKNYTIELTKQELLNFANRYKNTVTEKAAKIIVERNYSD